MGLDFLPAKPDRANGLFAKQQTAGKRHPLPLLLEREGLASIDVIDL